jgi:hypothetical protein
MDDDARRLVDNEEVFVRVGDRELGRRDVWFGGLLRRLDLDLLAAPEPVALSAWSSVDEDGAGLEQSLCGGARADLGESREVAVESLSRGLGGDDEPGQCFAGGGSRSARSSAMSRIPTPMTMKLSARLNAGQ